MGPEVVLSGSSGQITFKIATALNNRRDLGLIGGCALVTERAYTGQRNQCSVTLTCRMIHHSDRHLLAGKITNDAQSHIGIATPN